MKGEILKLLKGTDGYISGQELCERFRVSRTAVWKVINQLKEDGYEIEAVRNKGYHLRESSDVLTEAEILSILDTEWAGRHVAAYERTDSTNIRARYEAEKGAPHGTLVVAEEQDGGKGRRGRNWTSPAGVGIWMSLLLRPGVQAVNASMLTLVMALAAAEGVKRATGADALIKWPNDLVLNKKKICGILTEMSTELMEIQHVIIGVGINVAQTEFPGEIKETATSIYMETGRKPARSLVVAEILKAFEACYGEFVRTEDMSGLMDAYNARLVNRGNEVCVLDPAGEYRGVALGINKTGELLVELPDHTVREVLSGEVSVRGVYGYV